ncbi:MAG: OPT family oligopeptide transporter [Tepidisphaera sp.]|nr:OPT family oligopeptide transporter [Tepidisphaera sp.]
MAIEQLSEQQVREWSREQKDRWWFEKIYRATMPQLTLRAGLTGFLLGGVLCATNLYIGAKTGWSLGVGLTSVILAFAAFRIMSRLGVRDMTILENNCSQSVATAAGYMTGPLISGIAAYMWVQNVIMPWWQMLLFNVVLSVLGVLVAFPMKRRFINDEQQPFPEGRAAGVVLDALYTSEANVGMFKAKVLTFTALGAGLVQGLIVTGYLKSLHVLALMARHGESWSSVLAKYKADIAGTWHLPEDLSGVYAWLASKGMEPKLAKVPIDQLGLNPTLDLSMFGAGGLTGIKAASNMMLGTVINFVILVPLMIHYGEILPQKGSWEDGTAVFSRAWVVNSWALWWGIVIMVTASMVGLAGKPKVFVEAFKGLFARKKAGPSTDILKDIEFPLWISWVGIPVVGAIGVWMAHDWFGVKWVFGALAIPLIIVLTLIAASSTALTSITPTGSLSKIPQFIFGAADPKHPPTNLMTGVMCVEVASNASNLLMDIKPGYMLGAKPRQQAWGHLIGIFAGAIAATPLFYALFLSKMDPAKSIEQNMVTPQFGFPSAVQWKGVSELVTSIFGGDTSAHLLTKSIVTSMVVAGVVGLVFELARVFTKNKFPLSPMAIGLGVVIPPDSTFAMFCGATFFWGMGKVYAHRKNTNGHRLWVDSQEAICAGLIAGAALVAIGSQLLEVFAL